MGITIVDDPEIAGMKGDTHYFETKKAKRGVYYRSGDHVMMLSEDDILSTYEIMDDATTEPSRRHSP